MHYVLLCLLIDIGQLDNNDDSNDKDDSYDDIIIMFLAIIMTIIIFTKYGNDSNDY